MAKTPRVIEGFDRYGRWRSDAWRAFVRSLECSCREPGCPNCTLIGPRAQVVAAHLRSMAGIGAKPDDFLVYPLSDSTHKDWHAHGQPTVARQLELVAVALRAGFRQGVLVVKD